MTPEVAENLSWSAAPKKYKYQDKGFEIFAVMCGNEDKLAEVKQYNKTHGITWPQYFDGKLMDNEHVKRFGIVGVPQCLRSCWVNLSKALGR